LMYSMYLDRTGISLPCEEIHVLPQVVDVGVGVGVVVVSWTWGRQTQTLPA